MSKADKFISLLQVHLNNLYTQLLLTKICWRWKYITEKPK